MIVVIKTFVYLLAVMLWFRVIVWAAAEVKKEDSLDGMNYWDLKHEVERLEEHHRQRAKRRGNR